MLYKSYTVDMTAFVLYPPIHVALCLCPSVSRLATYILLYLLLAEKNVFNQMLLTLCQLELLFRLAISYILFFSSSSHYKATTGYVATIRWSKRNRHRHATKKKINACYEFVYINFIKVTSLWVNIKPLNIMCQFVMVKNQHSFGNFYK